MFPLQGGHRTYMVSVDEASVAAALDRADEAVRAGRPLAGTGFWPAVAAVKADPELVEPYADRIGAIDAAAFRNWAVVIVPLWIGNLMMGGGLLLGLALIAWAYSLSGAPAAIAFLLGFGAILVTTHGLAHLVTGLVVGIRFTRWFIGTWRRPQPGVKVDYSSYLRAAARSRAIMHASGAVVTKLVPFALIGAALASGAPVWVAWLLVATGVVTIVTDIVWSTRASDWKKYRREMGFLPSASEAGSGGSTP